MALAIAGLPVLLSTDHPSLRAEAARRYQKYATDQPPRLQAEVEVDDSLPFVAGWEVEPRFSRGAILFNQNGFRAEIDAGAGVASLQISAHHMADSLEYFLRAVWSALAFQAGGLLFHAAGIQRRGKVDLFFGPSGSGKSTLALLSTGHTILNDDLVVLMPAGGHWTAHATPFWNRQNRTLDKGPRAGALRALYRLVQDREVYLEQLPAPDALAELLAGIPLLAADPARSAEMMDRCQNLTEAAGVYALHFRKDRTFWQVLPPNRVRK
ncbi:MAG: hypothetical protein R3335_00055 [Anaerolineales bacterium]|nr:hypothetical protein [Anaerolineales bacterium]